MDLQTFDQIALDDDAFGDGPKYLKPNTPLQVSMYEGKPIVVTLPNTVDLEVTDTPPEIKGATATSQTKPATLETGLVVTVPPTFWRCGPCPTPTVSVPWPGRGEPPPFSAEGFWGWKRPMP